jgi:3',5'-cyclic AMP phosphodiesterase CpdA
VKLIHLTDTHLVAPPKKLFALDPRARLAPAVADINRRHADAEMVVVTGDLAHWGEPGAYAALKAILDELVVPCRLVLGNHDDRAAFLKVFPDSPRDEAGFVQWAEETPEGLFVFLDTLIPGTDGGALCEERLAWLERTLEGAEGRPVFLCLHHAPLDLGIKGMDAIRLHNPEALLARLQAHGQVRHIFFGHIHRAISGSWHGIPFSTLPGTNHQVMLNFHREDVPGSHEPPAYGVVLIERDSVVMHVHNYLDASLRFEMTEATEPAQEPEDLAWLDDPLEAHLKERRAQAAE